MFATKKMIGVLSLLWLLASPASDAAEGKTYNFTSNFINCVELNEGESVDGTNADDRFHSDSGLMNGSAELSGRALGQNYWNYMGCLVKESPFNNSDTRTGQSCSTTAYTLSNGRVVHLPGSVSGSIVNVGQQERVKFKCQGETWVMKGVVSGASRVDGDVIITPGGNGVVAPEPVENCDATSIVSENEICTFQLKEKRHRGDQKAYAFTETEDGYFFSGKMNATCYNGEFVVSAEVCEQEVCKEDMEVAWYTREESDGQNDSVSTSCRGEVRSDGVVEQQEVEPVFFGSVEQARYHTDIRVGQAKFQCKNKTWTKSEGSCRRKEPVELTCHERANSALGKVEYYCE